MIFGPVLAVSRFSAEVEAIEIADGTAYGLMAYVQIGDLARAHRVAARLEAGSVSINGVYGMAPNAPLGGVKASGFGRTGGRAGPDEVLRRTSHDIAARTACVVAQAGPPKRRQPLAGTRS